MNTQLVGTLKRGLDELKGVNDCSDNNGAMYQSQRYADQITNLNLLHLLDGEG